MRVLDVGCGAGDTTFLVAGIVGETGEVVGVDRAPAALMAARAGANRRSLRNVSFVEGDAADMTFDRPFDAVTGRYVLLFQRDPAAMLRKVAAHVRPGASIVFHELDWDGSRSSPPAPIYDTGTRWIVETFRLMDAETSMGLKLYATFVDAGLTAPSMRLEAVVGAGANGTDAVGLVADPLGTLYADTISLGVATAAEMGMETLARRMQDEVTANNSVLVARSEVGAWSHV